MAANENFTSAEGGEADKGHSEEKLFCKLLKEIGDRTFFEDELFSICS